VVWGFGRLRCFREPFAIFRGPFPIFDKFVGTQIIVVPTNPSHVGMWRIKKSNGFPKHRGRPEPQTTFVRSSFRAPFRAARLLRAACWAPTGGGKSLQNGLPGTSWVPLEGDHRAPGAADIWVASTSRPLHAHRSAVYIFGGIPKSMKTL
jgi:hypothetical protein